MKAEALRQRKAEGAREVKKQPAKKTKKPRADLLLSGDGVQVRVACAFTELAQIEKLKRNPRNPNVHPSSQVEILKRLIIEHGWRSAVVVSARSGMVTKGHGRLLAAESIGLSHVPIDVQPYKDEAEELRDMVADNAIQDYSELDSDLLRNIAQELQLSTEDFAMLGFIEADLQDILTPGGDAPEDFPPVNEEGIKTDHECPKCGFKFS